MHNKINRILAKSKVGVEMKQTYFESLNLVKVESVYDDASRHHGC